MLLTALQNHSILRPDDPAVRSDNEVLSYAELMARVNRLAIWLSSTHIHTVAFQLNNSIDWIVCDLAALKAKITIVPIPVFFTDAQTQAVIRDARVDLFISEISATHHGKFGSAWVTMVATPGLVNVAAAYILRKFDNAPVARKITYTSGSTGDPKGVCLSQATVDTVASSIVTALAPLRIRRHVCILPLATLLENIAGLYAPLIKGVEVVVPSDVGLTGSSSFDVNQFAHTFETYNPDSVILVPQLLMALTTLVEFKMVSPERLKMVAVGGGKVSQTLLKQAINAGIPAFEGYGLSEAASVLTLNLPGATRPGSVGKPLPHIEMRVDDAGQLLSKGSNMSGYLGDQPLNNEWLETGDLGCIDSDGYVYIHGRIKNQYITSYGRNINPEWVESELTRHPDIGQALIYGESRDYNLALIWPRFVADPETLEDTFKAIVREINNDLPDYAQVHQFILMSGEIDATLMTSNARMKREATISQYQTLIDNHYHQHQGRAHQPQGSNRVIL